jgi:general L-amino acid transport system permease protein
VEAARSLGLTNSQTLRLIVFPQALRIIVPPVTSQYLNLAKNSSLAIGIGYPDLFSVAGIIFNQTGAVLEIVTIMMLSYLSISLFISLLMNIYNRRIQLVERDMPSRKTSCPHHRAIGLGAKKSLQHLV